MLGTDSPYIHALTVSYGFLYVSELIHLQNPATVLPPIALRTTAGHVFFMIGLYMARLHYNRNHAQRSAQRPVPRRSALLTGHPWYVLPKLVAGRMQRM